jgi:hypothetical protein
VVDAFRSAARDKSFQVRDFTYDAEIIEAKVGWCRLYLGVALLQSATCRWMYYNAKTLE